MDYKSTLNPVSYTHLIQEDERFIAMRVASQQCDADEALQNMIGEFNPVSYTHLDVYKRQAQLLRNLIHFASRDAMDIEGLGPAALDQLCLLYTSRCV